jgi:hypothetical protein
MPMALQFGGLVESGLPKDVREKGFSFRSAWRSTAHFFVLLERICKTTDFRLPEKFGFVK